MAIFNMVGCGGGSSLNYEVVGGTSAPSSPSENTIWINTSNTITSHVFSATEPENPVEGMVWICVGTSSAVAFSATEENPVMVYPLSANQYVSGAWVDKTAKTYQNGEWVDWAMFLFDNGNECTYVTGGWEGAAVKGRANNTSDKATAPSITKGATYMIVSTSSAAHGVIRPKNLIDVTNFSTLRLKYSAATAPGWRMLSLTSRGGTWFEPSPPAGAWLSGGAMGTIYEAALDISALSGKYDIVIGMGQAADTIRIYEMVLEA